MSEATYVSSSSFTLSGDKRAYLEEGQRVLLTQGVDGTAEGSVHSVGYAGGNTTVTLTTSVVTSNLTDAKFGRTFWTDSGSRNFPSAPLDAMSIDDLSDVSTYEWVEGNVLVFQADGSLSPAEHSGGGGGGGGISTSDGMGLYYMSL